MHASFSVTAGVVLAIINGCSASDWATFSNQNCTTSVNTYAGQNGYPDGVCTSIPGTVDGSYEGFMFTVLDENCVRESEPTSAEYMRAFD